MKHHVVKFLVVVAAVVGCGVVGAQVEAAAVAPSLKASAGDHVVALKWSAASMTGRTRSGYTVQSRRHGTTTWSSRSATASATALSWTGLLNGVAYDFRVIAKFSGTTATTTSAIVTATPLTIWTQVSAGALNTCGVTSLGRVFCWGSGTTGIATSAVVNNSATPRSIALPKPVTSIAVGGEAACAVLVDGTVWCWGSDTYGQLGRGSAVLNTRFTPAAVLGLSGIVSVTAGNTHMCASSSVDSWCWGRNNRGQVGGVGDPVTSPRKVASTVDGHIVQISAGYQNTCGLTTLGSPWCWGVGADFANGNTSPTDAYDPAAVIGLAGGVTLPAVGTSHACTLAARRLLCWGTEADGEFGTATLSLVRQTPAPADSSLPDLVAVGAGHQATCGVTPAGKIWCFGRGDLGILGGGDLVTASTARPVLLPSGFVNRQLSVGSYHACAVDRGGAMYCWGYNPAKEVSSAYTPYVSVPIAVPRNV